MTWKRSGFAVEWYSPDTPNAEAWLNDIRKVWDMDLVTDLKLFIKAHAHSQANNIRLAAS